MALDPNSEDPYEGFNDYNHAYDITDALGDQEFIRAAARSSHSRRLPTAGRAAGPRLPSAAAGGRSAFGRAPPALARPMTAVRAAGYTSAGPKSTFEGVKALQNQQISAEELALRKIKDLEGQVKDLLVETVMAADERNFKLALDKAKEANRKEQMVKSQREQAGLPDNTDLTFSAQFALACQHTNNNMINEAINMYELILSNESFENAKRLNVNLGNLYFRRRDYTTALKYYHKALDRVPHTHKRTQAKIVNNIGVTQIRLGNYEGGRDNFAHCVGLEGEYASALNLILAAYCLDDADGMKDAFQRLLDIPTLVAEEGRHAEQDILVQDAINNDSLKRWERQRQQQAEHTIMAAARVISARVARSFSDGYAWCLAAIQQSLYAGLATELQMNKAVELLRLGRLDDAADALAAFAHRESKVASAAANNLAMLNILRGRDKLDEATEYAEKSLQLDRYNCNSLVNRGNIYYEQGEPKLALQCYREALQVEPSCIQAMFNIGLLSKETDDYETALQTFYKLRNLLPNNVQVLVQLASLYESSDPQQAIDLYTDASSLSPTDPALLAKLGQLYDAMGDKNAALNCMTDSYRVFPANIEVIKWLGNYNVENHIPESSIKFFEKAAIMEPHNVEWHLLMAACQRRAGQLQKAMDLYKQIHLLFPTNVECLRHLVQLCRDLRLLDDQAEYEKRLRRLDQGQQRRVQRESDSGQLRRSNLNSAASLPPPTRGSHNSAAANRHSSARALLESSENTPYRAQPRQISAADLAFEDPVGPPVERPKTGANRNADPFDMHDLGAADLLPE